MIDGQFGDGEWDGVVVLEGVFTDLYLDYQPPYLYALNDWRANEEDIRPDCYNEFAVNIGLTVVVVKVFGDGEITIGGAELDGEGAYSLSPSPRWSSPHTIYEFRLDVPASCPICIRLKDPTSGSNCKELTDEPVVFAIDAGALPARVARVPDADVTRLGPGAACGNGEGICGSGLTCTQEGGSPTCVEQDPPEPDDGRDGSSDAEADVPDATLPDAGSDIPEEPPPDADPEGPGEDGPW